MFAGGLSIIEGKRIGGNSDRAGPQGAQDEGAQEIAYVERRAHARNMPHHEGTPFLRERPRPPRAGSLVLVVVVSLALLSARAARRPTTAAARTEALWADDGGVLGDWRATDDDAANATSRRAGKDRDNCKVFKRTLGLYFVDELRG